MVQTSTTVSFVRTIGEMIGYYGIPALIGLFILWKCFPLILLLLQIIWAIISTPYHILKGIQRRKRVKDLKEFTNKSNEFKLTDKLDKLVLQIPKTKILRKNPTEGYNLLKNELNESIEYIKSNLPTLDVFWDDKNNVLIKNSENFILYNDIFRKLLDIGINSVFNTPIDNETSDRFYNQNKYVLDLLKTQIDNLLKDIAILKKGEIGEENVAKSLRLFKDRYHILYNIRVVVDGQSSESDAIIVTEKGIFIVEIKNYGKDGQTLRVTRDGQWTLEGISYKKNIKDAVGQNNYHCALTSTLINRELQKNFSGTPYLDCIPMICIGNDDVSIINDSRNIIVRASNIITELNYYQSNVKLSKEVQDEIEDILKRNSLPPKDFEIESRYESIIGIVEAYKEYLNINSMLKDISISYEKIV